MITAFEELPSGKKEDISMNNSKLPKGFVVAKRWCGSRTSFGRYGQANRRGEISVDCSTGGTKENRGQGSGGIW